MPFNLGPVELGLILLIVAMLFGVGKLPEVFGSIGKGVREFRKEAGMDENGKPTQTAQQPQVLPPAQAPVAQLPATSTAAVTPVAPVVAVEQVPVAAAPVVESKPVVTE